MPVLRLALLFVVLLAPSAGAQGLEEHFDFDEQGRLIRHINPMGLTTELTYDAQGRLIRIDGSDDAARFGYDPAGRHAWSEDGVAIVQYDYDALDRLRATRYRIETPDGGVLERAIAYRYDDLGRISGVALAESRNDAGYAVALDHDVSGRLVGLETGGASVAFTYSANGAGSVVTRTLPSGMVSVMHADPVGLPLSVSHRRAPDAEPFQLAEIGYDLAQGAVRVARTRDGTAQIEAFDLHAVPEIADPPRAALRMSVDRRVLSSVVDGQTRYFLNAPTGPGQGLAIEIDPSGRATAAFVVADNVSIEHDLGSPPVLYLEDPGFDPVDPFYVRASTGQSLAARAEVISVERGPFTVATLPAGAPSMRRLPFDVGEVLSNAGTYDTTVNALHFLAYGGPYQGDTILDTIRVLDSDLGEALEQVLPAGETILGLAERGSAVYSDLAGLATDRTTLGRRILEHGVFGQVSEYVARERLSAFMKTRGFGASTWADTALGIGYTVARAASREEGWQLGDTVSVAEAITDQFLRVSTFNLALLVTGNPLAAEAFAGLVVAFAGEMRVATQDFFMEAMREPYTRMAYASRGQTGQYIYAAASALLRGNVDGFLETYAPEGERADIFRTVMGGDGPSLWVGTAWRNQSYRRFQELIENRDWDGASQMIRTDRHLRRALREAGILDATIDALVNAQPVREDENRVSAAPAAGLGGIDLDIANAVWPSIGRISAAAVDPQTGRIALVGDGDLSVEPLDLELLAAALAAARRGESIQFSLDPVTPSDPHTWQEAAYYPDDILAGTRAGQVLYEADLDLKLLAFGAQARYGPWRAIDAGGTQVTGPVEVWLSNRFRPLSLGPRAPLWPGFRSVPEISMALADQTASRARQWIVVDHVEVREEDGLIVFGEARLGVSARRQEIGTDGRLHDVDADEPAADAFAAQLTADFDRAAAQVPSFARLQEFAKVMAFAEWLVRNDIRTDPGWADGIGDDGSSVREVSTLHWAYQDRDETVTADARTRTIAASTRRIDIAGGVDLTITTQDTPGARPHLTRDRVLAAMRDGEQVVFAVAADAGPSPVGVVLPLSEGAAALWRAQRVGAAAGLSFATDAAGRFLSGRDQAGGRVQAQWGPAGLTALSRTLPYEHVEWRAQEGGADRVTHRPGGGRIDLRLREGTADMLVDGVLERRYSLGPDDRTLRIDHPPSGAWSEILFDRDGTPMELRRQGRAGQPPAVIAIEDHRPEQPGAALPTVPPTVRSSLYGLQIEAEYDADGRLRAAQFGDLWSLTAAFDETTGLGVARIGAAELTVHEPAPGLRRVSITSP